MWAPPQQFDEYRLVRSLGRGAMGQVYVAYDEFLDREVAIKFVGTTDDGVARARFRNEARAIARLQHSNVVVVYRIGEVVGQPYIVSELVRGKTLDTLSVPVDMKLGLHIAIDLARGLAAAHRHGVLHRDIKPSNAILGDDGSTKLLDFGLAKLTHDELRPQPERRASSRPSIDALDSTIDGAGDSTQELASPDRTKASAEEHDEKRAANSDGDALRLTATDAIVGTPLYLAPECWELASATTESDIYSLGAVMFHLFSGRPPHQADTVMMLGHRVVSERAPELASIAGVDRDLSAIVARCLAHDPGDRYASAEQLCDALEAVAARTRRARAHDGNPYRGLLAFDEGHHGLFFGRSAEVRNVAERLRSESFVVVAGDSGVGKSSLCQAGVVPVFVDSNAKWRVQKLVPGRRPRQKILNAIADSVESDAALVRQALEEQPTAVLRQLPELRAGEGLLLFIDQLEQLITLSDRAEAIGAAELIEQLCRDVPGLKILATVRSDHLAQLATLGTFGDPMSRALYLLPSMNAQAMRAAITEPARMLGIEFESSELVERLVAAGSHTGSLGLLQFTLGELWDTRDQQRNLITAKSLDALGGVEGALAAHAENVFARLRPDERETARVILTGLVGGDAQRVTRDLDDLVRISPEGRRVIEALVRGRLITATEGERGAVYAIAHEALLQGWERLADWLDTDTYWRRQRSRVEELARDWVRLGKPRDHLLRASRLRELRSIDSAALSDDATALLRTSRRARAARWIAIGAVLATTSALIGGGIVFARRADERYREHVIASRHSEARRQLADASVEDLRAHDLRHDAFTAFDSGNDEDGERLWKQARSEEQTTSQRRLQATLYLEATLSLAPQHPVTRSLLAEVIDERANDAERDRRDDALTELLARLEAVAPESVLLKSWRAPARIDVHVTPSIASIRLERYSRDGDGRLTAKPVGDWPAKPDLIAGSYRLIAVAPERTSVTVPLLLVRGEVAAVRVELPEQASVPDDFVFVPEGHVLYGSTAEEDLRSVFFKAPPIHQRSVAAFLIARHETTFAQWIEFLEELPAAERDRRLPRPGTWGKVALTRLGPSSYEVTMTATNAELRARSGERLTYQGRDRRQQVDWMKLPVSGISTEDALAYTRWLAGSGRVLNARLCTEVEWERAARGADDRPYPHGSRLQADDANILTTYHAGAGPDEVGSHPASRSPFGIDDLTGNVFELTTHATRSDRFVARGGGFFFDSVVNQIANRTDVETDMLGLFVGLRVCATPHR